MTLPRDYRGQTCALSRAMEVVGERWTLLILRDAFYGVRRFGEFAAHLAAPRAVLADRLAGLVAAGVLDRRPEPGTGRREAYVLTEKGLGLWPAVRALTDWGEQHAPAPGGPRRLFLHHADGARVGPDGRCSGCGTPVPPGDLLVAPGPGLGADAEGGADPGTDGIGTEADSDTDSGTDANSGTGADSGTEVDPVTAALARPHRLLTPLLTSPPTPSPTAPVRRPSKGTP
ncbi:DNA-binding HxlR family transcriptional regulator [Streptomyces filamentosus]